MISEEKIKELHKRRYSRYQIFQLMKDEVDDHHELYMRILPHIERDLYLKGLLLNLGIVIIILTMTYHYLIEMIDLLALARTMTESELRRLYYYSLIYIALIIGLLRVKPRLYYLIFTVSGILLFLVPLITLIAFVSPDIPANRNLLILWNLGTVSLLILAIMGKNLTAPFLKLSSILDRRQKSHRISGYRFRRDDPK